MINILLYILTVLENSIGGYGGALMAFSASVPGAVTLIQDCKFLGNSATSGSGECLFLSFPLFLYNTLHLNPL